MNAADNEFNLGEAELEHLKGGILDLEEENGKLE